MPGAEPSVVPWVQRETARSGPQDAARLDGTLGTSANNKGNQGWFKRAAENSKRSVLQVFLDDGARGFEPPTSWVRFTDTLRRRPIQIGIVERRSGRL
jgi:hypothetical protein